MGSLTAEDGSEWVDRKNGGIEIEEFFAAENTDWKECTRRIQYEYSFSIRVVAKRIVLVNALNGGGMEYVLEIGQMAILEVSRVSGKKKT